MRVRVLSCLAALLGAVVPLHASAVEPPDDVVAAGEIVLGGAGVLALDVPRDAVLDVDALDVPALEVSGGGAVAGVVLTGSAETLVLLRLPEPVGGRTEAVFAVGSAVAQPRPGPVGLPAGRYLLRVLGDDDVQVVLRLGGLDGTVEAVPDPRAAATAASPGASSSLPVQDVWGAAVTGGVGAPHLRLEVLWTQVDGGTTPTTGRYGFCREVPEGADPARNAALCQGADVPNGGFYTAYTGLALVQVLLRTGLPGGTSRAGAYGQTTGAVPRSGYAVHWSAT